MNSPHFEKLFSAITEDDRYRGEMAAAKSEFERVAGQIMETDNSYDARINAFHNWYILDRPLSSTATTPLEYFIEFNANTFSEEEGAGLRDLAANIHSLFELLKFSKGRVLMRDLMSRKKHLVEGAEQLGSLERGDLFNTRIFRHGDKEYLTNYLLLHPYSVAKMVKSEARKVRKAKENPKAFLFHLLFFHSRWEQFSQMDVNKIYRFETVAGVPQPV